MARVSILRVRSRATALWVSRDLGVRPMLTSVKAIPAETMAPALMIRGPSAVSACLVSVYKQIVIILFY